MKDCSSTVVYRLIDTNGEQVGAELCFHGASMRLDIEGVVRFGDYLHKHNLRTYNAEISEDGSLFPMEGKELLNLAIEDRPKKETDYVSFFGTLHREYRGFGNLASDAMRKHGVRGVAEGKLLTVIQAGLALASLENIDIYRDDDEYFELIESIEKLELQGRRSAAFMKVHVRCAPSGFYPLLDFTCYLDNTLVLTAWLYDTNEPTTEYEVRCKSAVDIRNSLLWLKNISLTRRSYGSEFCTEYLKCKQEMSVLVAESKLLLKKPNFEPIKLRHWIFETSFLSHVTDFSRIREVLNARFIGTYMFDWEIGDRLAVLSVSTYDGACIVELRLELRFSCLTTLIPTSHISPIPHAVCVKYKIIDAAGTQTWVDVVESIDILWLNELGNAIETVLGSILRPGVLRDTTDVIACGMYKGERSFFIRGQEKPLSEIELVQKGVTINGVCLKVLSDKSLKVDSYGYDRFGNELPRYVEIEGRGYFCVSFGFCDLHTSEWRQVSTMVPLDDYYNAPSLTLNTHVEYINGMLLNIHRGPLDYLGGRLNEVAVEYSEADRLSLLFRCMRCFTLLVAGNKTPVEVLLERSGGSIELSLIAVTLAHKLGIASALLLRYTTNIDAVAILLAWLVSEEKIDGEAEVSEILSKLASDIYNEAVFKVTEM